MPKPACSISQAAEVLTRPSSARPPRRGLRQGSRLVGGEHRVGEERAGAPGVVVLGVQHHALAAAQLEHGSAYVGRRHPLADLDAEAAGQLGVADRCAQPGVLEGERHGQHDVPVGPLEHAVAVAEAALRRAQQDDVVGAAVQGADPADGLGDLLAVGADVLDRGGADAAGDAGERLEPGVPLVDRVAATTWSQSTPASTCSACSAQRRHGDPAGGDLEHGAVEALVGHHQVAAAAQDQQRLGSRCRRPGPPRRPRPRSRPPAAAEPGRRGAGS